MKAPTIEELKAQFTELGYKWPAFHIVGIRSKANLPNQFDDLIGMVQGDQVKWYTGTTNPGTFWLNHPMNSLGTAVLKAGQYIDTYTIGLHQGKYTALKQSKKVTVYRDADKDSVAEEQGKEDTGLFGINIHRANESTESKNVDKWSAGCQVMNNPSQFKELIQACIKSGKKSFTYTLLKES
jgi:acid phosphatase class B